MEVLHLKVPDDLQSEPIAVEPYDSGDITLFVPFSEARGSELQPFDIYGPETAERRTELDRQIAWMQQAPDVHRIPRPGRTRCVGLPPRQLRSARTSRRESHARRPGHRRVATRSSARSGDSGDPDSEPPRRRGELRHVSLALDAFLREIGGAR